MWFLQNHFKFADLDILISLTYFPNIYANAFSLHLGSESSGIVFCFHAWQNHEGLPNIIYTYISFSRLNQLFSNELF